jgi:hypothetical protein
LADAAGNPKRHQQPSQTNPSAKFQAKVHVQLHGLTKAIKDPKYADEFKGKTLTFEDGVSNARPGDHNSRIDISTDEPYRMIEIKNYSGDTKISGDVIRSQFIERDLFNASSLDEIRWLQVGPSTTSKETIVNHLKSNKDAISSLGATKVESLFKVTGLDDEFPDEIANVVINYLEKDVNFEKIFK